MTLPQHPQESLCFMITTNSLNWPWNSILPSVGFSCFLSLEWLTSRFPPDSLLPYKARLRFTLDMLLAHWSLRDRPLSWRPVPPTHSLLCFMLANFFGACGSLLPRKMICCLKDMGCVLSSVFYFLFIFYFFIFLISWRLITLQYCSGFCHTLTWISHGFTCVPHPIPLSHLRLHPIPLGLPNAPGPSTCLMHPTWAGDLFHPR